MLSFSNVTAQNTRCIVFDELTHSERTALGISDQKFLASKNFTPQFNSIVPNNYPLTPKKFNINLWSVVPDNATEGVISYAMALKYIERLNRIYQPYQICFVLNGLDILI